MYGQNNELYMICIYCESITWLYLYNIPALLQSCYLTFAIWSFQYNFSSISTPRNLVKRIVNIYTIYTCAFKLTNNM